MLQKERSVPKQLGRSRYLNTLQKKLFSPKRAQVLQQLEIMNNHNSSKWYLPLQ